MFKTLILLGSTALATAATAGPVHVMPDGGTLQVTDPRPGEQAYTTYFAERAGTVELNTDMRGKYCGDCFTPMERDATCTLTFTASVDALYESLKNFPYIPNPHGKYENTFMVQLKVHDVREFQQSGHFCRKYTVGQEDIPVPLAYGPLCNDGFIDHNDYYFDITICNH